MKFDPSGLDISRNTEQRLQEFVDSDALAFKRVAVNEDQIAELLLGHLTWNGKRLLGAMVLDQMNTESLSTRAVFPDCFQRLVNGQDSVNGLNPLRSPALE